LGDDLGPASVDDPDHRRARPRYGVLLLACLYGVDCASTALGQLNNIPALRELPAATLIAWAAIGGSVFGDVGFSLFGWLVGLSGRLLGGQGTLRGTRAALAWGSVPNLVPVAQLMASFLISGRGFLSPDSDAKPDPLLLAYLASSLVFGIWTAVVTLKCVGEVHRFSSWKAFASLLLASLAGIALVVLAGVLFAALKAA